MPLQALAPTFTLVLQAQYSLLPWLDHRLLDLLTTGKAGLTFHHLLLHVDGQNRCVSIQSVALAVVADDVTGQAND